MRRLGPYLACLVCCLHIGTLTGIDGSSLRRRRDSDNVWGGVCQYGKSQSPVNIKLADVVVTRYPRFEYDDAYLGRQEFVVHNTGHTVQLSLRNPALKPKIYGGGLPGTFIFQQLHFHWDSEHEFDGKRADLEMHMVHYNAKYENFNAAVTKKDGLVVLAILFDRSEDNQEDVENFFSFVYDGLSGDGGLPAAPPQNSLGDDDIKQKTELFSLRDLLPADPVRFFRYDGSLTTPGCNEVVQWTVFINRFYVSNYTLTSFRTIRDSHGHLLLSNNRPVQELQGRTVYVQMVGEGCGEDANGIDGCRNSAQIGKWPSTSLAIVVTASALTRTIKIRM